MKVLLYLLGSSILIGFLVTAAVIAVLVTATWFAYWLRGYCDDNEIDLRYRLSWLRPAYIWMRVRETWRFWKQAFWAWRRGLVRLPGGVLAITSIKIGNTEQLSGEIPADLFHEANVGMSLSLSRYTDNYEISVTYVNKSAYTFEVRSSFFARIFTADNGMYVLPLPAFTAEPRAQNTVSIRPERPAAIQRFVVSLPKYVARVEVTNEQRAA